MKLDPTATRPSHLTYCSNIHPGESWAEVFSALRTHVPRVRKAASLSGPFGLGLRLSAEAAHALREPETLDTFRAWLDETDAYVFTLNGFPYGPFHGVPVKEAVYRPDWSTPQRLLYTQDLIELLATLGPRESGGSISTVPGAFRHDASATQPETIAGALARAAHRCWELAQDQGLDLCLGLEPEPMCMLETNDEAIDFLEGHVFRGSGREQFVRLSGCDPAQAEHALRRHVGICFDTCHAAVEFEDPTTAPQRILDAGIRVAKVQVTAGLALRTPTAAGIERLGEFSEDTYLHQVVVRSTTGMTRFLDLPDALAQWQRGALRDGEWRVHLHVPVFADLEPPLESTAHFIPEALRVLRGACRHFEVETYTWSVLPNEFRSLSVHESIARELQWAQSSWQHP